MAPTQNQALAVVGYDELSNYRKVHYGKHIIGHPFSEVGQPMQNGQPVSPTTLVGVRATSEEMYLAGSEIASRIDVNIYQYKHGNETLKVSLVDGSHVELTIFRQGSDGYYEFVTSFDQFTLTEARANISNGEWQ